MATFYIQLENKLLKISGELTAENISKALGYVPVDSSTMDNYATKDEVSDLVDIPIVTELQGKVNTLIDTDSNKSVRDIAVDVLTETLVSETATEACYVGFDSGRVDWYSNSRYLGRSVRPVCQ